MPDNKIFVLSVTCIWREIFDEGKIRLNTPLNIQNISKSFGKSNILSDISLSIAPAELFGLLGPSGAGKTTLVRIISGLIRQDKGEVFVLGSKMPSREAIKRIGLMMQADALYSDLSAWDNMDFFSALYGLCGKGKRSKIEEALELVTLTQDSKKKVKAFSGGMKRRLSLAIAIVHEPELLILDEPTIGMDPLLRKAVWDEFYKLKKKGTTIIITTHAMEEADKCDRIGMIRQGCLIAAETPENLKLNAGAKNLEDAFIAFAGGAL